MKYIFIVILFAVISCKKKEPEDTCTRYEDSVTNKDYIETDTTSNFYGKNTVKFTLVSKTKYVCAELTGNGYSKVYCESNEFSIENLTDKQISVRVNLNTLIEALPKSKSVKSVSIEPYVMSCRQLSQILVKVTYN
jgi:hypothetical protein